MPVLTIRSISVRVAVALATATLTWPLFSACGEDGDNNDSGEVGVPSSTRRDPSFYGHYDIGEARALAILASDETSPVVKVFLKDRKLEFAEYEAAVLAMLSCVSTTGASIRDRVLF